MTQRTALIIAATITAFVLVLLGGVATYITQQSPASASAAPAAVSDATVAPAVGLDPTAVQQAIKEHDEIYQQRLQQANDTIQRANEQLQDAYRKQQELAAQLNQSYQQQRTLARTIETANQRRQQAPVTPRQDATQPETTLQPAAPPAYPISPDAAAGIALGAAPGATLTRAPELVSFQGMVAYEVVLDRGTVYVDANNGQLLYNGATIVVDSGGGGGHHEDGDHEGSGGDD